MKSETRSPKAERRPKSEARTTVLRRFEFRPSDFFRISAFGFRPFA